jgi:hypothetical protein
MGPMTTSRRPAERTEAETLATCDAWLPKIRARDYWPVCLLLVASYGAPIVTWIASRDWQLMGRSGSVTLFFAAIAEFFMLNRMNRKHLLNDCRVKAGQRPWDISKVASRVSVASFVAGLLGTLLWGYGDFLAGAP